MDAKALLEDLHFQLSITDGSLSITSELRQLSHLHETVQFVEEDRMKMTEKWVANVCHKNRSRCLSFNSYFEEDSVCNKLKKCLLKSFVVNEEDLENLRLRLAALRIGDPNVINEENLDSLKLRFSKRKIKDHIGQDCLKGSESEKDDIQDQYQNITSSTHGRRPGHTRSKTVPLLKEVDPQVYYDIAKVTVQSAVPQCDHPAQNMVMVESTKTKKEILVDENSNLIDITESVTDLLNCPATISKPSTTTEEIKITCFRHENLYPTAEELLGQKKNTETLNSNKIVGSYDNEEHYFQTQFYLLREDFIRPLKAGIAHYRMQLRAGSIPDEIRDMKLYHNARLIEPRFRDGKLGVAIDVGFPLPENIGDKDFMDGSLVLITTNHFKNVKVGTVLSRNFIPSNFIGNDGHAKMDHKRRSNILLVQLHGNSHFDPALKHRKVLLAESQAFFQPYYYVMKILQQMTSDDLPLKENILGSTNAVVKPPSYLVDNTKYLLEGHYQVEVKRSSSWPRAEALNVNDSQLRAFEKALTERLVLIQGPPGTGKTYLGCKVAKVLLQNRQVWNKEGNQPFLLMCQSNHALDQFMEQLLPVTKNIIRIGSQSKSDILAPYTLREHLKKGRNNFSKQGEIDNQKLEVKKLATNLKSCYVESSKLMSHGIIDIDTFLSVGIVDLKHTYCFESSENYLMWLDEAKLCETIHESNTAQLCKAVSEKLKNCCSTHTSMSSYEHLQVTSDVPEESKLCSGMVPIESFSVKYALSLSDFKAALSGQLSNIEPEETNTDDAKIEIEKRLQFYELHLSAKNRDASNCTYVTNQCLWTVPPCMRWHLYRSWVQKLERMMQSYLEIMEAEFLSASLNVNELMQSQKLEALRQAELIGMTTSAAARLHPVLCELHCPIVLVEEAAEVHESHIVATVTKHCQHLILLGDHKQLRPRPACYSLSQTHFTDVSLFERLVLNNTVKVNTLLTQHRMQPQISALIRPSIYAELYDHGCTKNRKNILGVRKNVFFFTHSWQEKKNLITGSYCNPQEARMAVQLLRYLILEGYSASEVCIITAYREQLKEIENESSIYPELDDVRVLTVDNFQGEECKIVILSLVRNNSANQIGFLKIENRVCVALSRARDGFFMLGNMNLLSSNSDLWQSVYKVLQANASVGWFFPLRCPRHPRKRTAVSQPDDLLFYIHQGGCQQTCLFKLPCGHFCKRNCHSDDTVHHKYRCEELCKNKCASGHPCQKRCSEKCGDCEFIVRKQLRCGHRAIVRCSLDLEHYLCEVAIRKSMDPCSHSMILQCWMPPLSGKYCPHQCPFPLKCGHQCPLQCNSSRHPSHSEIECLCEHQFL